MSKIIDLHCDTISAILKSQEELYINGKHFDLKRAKIAGVGTQFFALFTMPTDYNSALRSILTQIDCFYQQLEKYQEHACLVRNCDELLQAEKEERLGCILHLEGGEALGLDMAILRLLHRLGLRSIGLTWNERNQLADGIYEGEQAGGLSARGKSVVKEMEKLGISLDLAHISENSFYDALENYNKPVMVTHANAQSLCNHGRNLTDHQLRMLAENGGIIGVTQVNSFVKEQGAKLEDLVNHIVYISELIGTEHVALGSDFDGADDVVMQGIEEYKDWGSILAPRGFNQEEIDKILRDNALRVINQVLV